MNYEEIIEYTHDHDDSPEFVPKQDLVEFWDIVLNRLSEGEIFPGDERHGIFHMANNYHT